MAANRINARSTDADGKPIEKGAKAAAFGAAANAGTKAIKAEYGLGKLSKGEATAKAAQTALRALGIII